MLVAPTNLIRSLFAITLVMLSAIACSFAPPQKGNSTDVLLPTNTPRPTFTATIFAEQPRPAPGNNATPLPTPIPIMAATEIIVAHPTGEIIVPSPTALAPTQTASQNSNPTVTSLPPQSTSKATTTVSPTDKPSPTATYTASPPPSAAGWEFTALKQTPDEDGSAFIITGEMVNRSGETQRLNFITGDFFDVSGKKIAGEDETSDYWATEMIPPDGRLPFELTVYGINQATKFDLFAQSESTSETVYSDFQAENLTISQELESFCVDGDVNFGDKLKRTLVILVTGYNAGNAVVSFGDDYFLIPDDIELQTDFSICIDDTEPSSIDHYLIQIWGE